MAKKRPKAEPGKAPPPRDDAGDHDVAASDEDGLDAPSGLAAPSRAPAKRPSLSPAIDAETKRERRRGQLRIAAIAVGVIAIAAAAASIDLEPNLEHIRIGVVSGPETGNYYAMADSFSRRASIEGGTVRNVTTQGSRENLRLLTTVGDTCEIDFGLLQDGAFEPTEDIELIARLTARETVFFLGRDADLITDFRDLDGLRIGAGPEESGTAELVAALFALPGFERIDVEVVHGPVADQIAAAVAGELDLAISVVYRDATPIVNALSESGLTMASFSSAPAVAGRLRATHQGVLPAGYYDAIAGIPASDRQVLEIDTLLVSNHCASRSEVNAILAVLAEELPGFIELNRREVPPRGLAMNSVATEFYENHGPPLVDQYLPSIVDVIPLSNFMTFVMALSLLFNAMGGLNRFRLWRLDAVRAKVEGELTELFGGGITRADIEHLDPDRALATVEERARLDSLIARLSTLLTKCRSHAVSMLVPMGQEMVYRYQETLILDLLANLKRFRQSLPMPAESASD